MREFIPNVITPEEAALVVDEYINKNITDPEAVKGVIDKMKAAIEGVVKPNWDPPTWTRVEKSRKGHGWHIDTGSNNHMMWCDFGCSILLTNTEDSGFLEYRDGTKMLPEEHFCGLAIHSSDVEHRAEQGGGRVAFLAFIVEDKSEEK